jgi:hypothetical protein
MTYLRKSIPFNQKPILCLCPSNVTQIEEIGDWQLGSDKIVFYHDTGSMIPIHYNLTQRGYKALIYRFVKAD